jgi:phosphoglycolate phosphatase-like HAD superfamily hydrolase
MPVIVSPPFLGRFRRMRPAHPSIPGTAIEIVSEPVRGRIRHALFDFDGTLSYVRDGWQDAMVPMMVEVLAACPLAESREALERLVIDFVDHLTGKQTIYQMIRLAEEVERRGGKALEPLAYKQIYNERLQPTSRERLAGIRAGRVDPEAWRVPGSLALLEELRRRGVKLYLASGTDIEFVEEEAAALDLARFFDGGIFGALPNYQDFSKEKVIRRILADFSLSGPELLVIGDGYVEILNGRQVGAVAVGLVSVERNRYHMNADKYGRLLRAGAQLLMGPDFREGPELLRYLFP